MITRLACFSLRQDPAATQEVKTGTGRRRKPPCRGRSGRPAMGPAARTFAPARKGARPAARAGLIAGGDPVFFDICGNVKPSALHRQPGVNTAMRFVLMATDLDLAVMQLHDALHQRQPQPAARCRVGAAVQFFEKSWEALRAGCPVRNQPISTTIISSSCKARISTSSPPEENLSAFSIRLYITSAAKIAIPVTAGNGQGTCETSRVTLRFSKAGEARTAPTTSSNRSGISTGAVRAAVFEIGQFVQVCQQAGQVRDGPFRVVRGALALFRQLGLAQVDEGSLQRAVSGFLISWSRR